LIDGISKAQTLNSLRNLKSARREVKDTTLKLASGKRINSSKDDASGLSVSLKLKGKIKSQRMASRNANQAVSIVQIADGAVSEISNMIIRLRELTIQSMNDTNSREERYYIGKEVEELKREIHRIGKNTSYLNTKVLDGKTNKLSIQIGGNAGANNKLDINVIDFAATVESLGITNVAVNNNNESRRSLSRLDYALDELSKTRAYYGAIMTTLKASAHFTDGVVGAKSNAKSKIMDADYAQEASKSVSAKIKENANIEALTSSYEPSANAYKLLKD
jgi:flagellin